MIESFKHKGLKRLHKDGDASGVRPDMLDKIERILTVLDAASGPEALDLPGFRLHPLKAS